MLKAEKTKLIEELKQKLQNSRSVFLADFTGLNVEDMTRLRRNLREKDIQFKISKNSLARLAASQADKAAIVAYLEGPIGLAFISGDPTWAAKIFYESFKKIEKPKIRAFLIDNQIYTGEKLKEWATLPPKEEVLSELLATLNSPLANLVGILNAIIQNLLFTLEGVAQKKSQETPAQEVPATETPSPEIPAPTLPVKESQATPTPASETEAAASSAPKENQEDQKNQDSENQTT